MKVKLFTVTAVAMLVAGLTCNNAHAAAYVSTADGNGADVGLENDNQGCDGTDPICTAANMNGADTNMGFRRLDGTRQKLFILRFDITDLDASSYADASLAFHFTSNRNRDMRVYGIADGFDNWDEATLNYLTAPGILDLNDAPAGPDAVAAEIGLNPTELFFGAGPNPFQLGVIPIFDSEIPPGGGADVPGLRQVTVSDPASLPLESFLNADTDNLVTMLLFLDISNSSPFGGVTTKEGSAYFAPRLGIIPDTFVPEPTTACMALFAAAAIASRRRV